MVDSKENYKFNLGVKVLKQALDLLLNCFDVIPLLWAHLSSYGLMFLKHFLQTRLNYFRFC